MSGTGRAGRSACPISAICRSPTPSSKPPSNAAIPRNPDFNGAAQEGFGYYQFTTRNGRRCSTAVGYLKPARKRGNLKVASSALATRILLEGKRAVGVEYLQGDQKREARAGEVILAGGAFNSPQLMQLSGLGPAALLREHGIAVAADMPGVGADLQDHYHARLVYRATQPVSANDFFSNKLRGFARRRELSLPPARPARDGRGLCGRLPAHQRGGRDARRADPHHAVLGRRDRRPAASLLGRDLSGDRAAPGKPRHGAHQVGRSARSRPRSGRTISRPRKDRDTTIAGIRVLRRIMAAPPMAPFIEAEHEPGPACASDDDLLDYVRRRGSTVYHPTSTCRMGSDPTAVVDARLRVHGIERLRVVDASIMPALVSGNTNAPTIMIAEKGADMILEDARAR